MEKWNAYTKDAQLTDKILIRGEAIPKGLYFMACGVLVRHKDGSYLCMKQYALWHINKVPLNKKGNIPCLA